MNLVVKGRCPWGQQIVEIYQREAAMIAAPVLLTGLIDQMVRPDTASSVAQMTDVPLHSPAMRLLNLTRAVACSGTVVEFIGKPVTSNNYIK